jgi:hypothetical protein
MAVRSRRVNHAKPTLFPRECLAYEAGAAVGLGCRGGGRDCDNRQRLKLCDAHILLTALQCPPQPRNPATRRLLLSVVLVVDDPRCPLAARAARRRWDAACGRPQPISFAVLPCAALMSHALVSLCDATVRAWRSVKYM